VIDWDALPAQLGELKGQIVPAPRLDISASAIRARVRAGKSIRYLVTPEVEQYIFEHRLYGV
jgi:nicotinate-nucleotide adenylyltransferase